MRASDFINERPKRVLTIFDIDDTLFHTTAKINVVKDGKVVRSLTNQEFNNYELQDGEEYDFGEFRNAEKFRQESEPIGPMLDELKTILDHTQGKVIMLTARADFDDKETFLQTFADHGIDMSKIHVHRAGNLPGKEGPAEKKAVWVRRYLDTGKFNQVSLYDDSMSNLRVFKSLEQEYPDVKFDAYHITGEGDVKSLEERKKKKRKSKRVYGAAWGPGPYGLYGWDSGYSSAAGVSSGEVGGGDGGGMESRLNEAWTQDKQQRIKDFALWAIKLLEIEQAPKIKLVADSGTTALGYFDPETQNIVVTVKDRHQMDIMRTLAHELVHRKQNEARELDGATGSDDENEANALAGVLLRWWGRKNPEQFNEAWSAKYKRSINCNNPKGFSQRAHCQGRKKEDINTETNKLIPYPKGTVKVDVDDVYDWYKLGMNISDLDDADPEDFGKGPPQTVLSFGSEPIEHKYMKALQRLKMKTHDLDEFAPSNDDSGDEDMLFKYAKMWYNNDTDVQEKIEKILDQEGWEIGEIESEEGGVFVVQSGDENGNSYIGWPEAELTNIDENFADGRNPQDKGDSKRHGITKGMSIAQLKKIRSSKTASPRKKQLAHWQINMRQGKKK